MIQRVWVSDRHLWSFVKIQTGVAGRVKGTNTTNKGTLLSRCRGLKDRCAVVHCSGTFNLKHLPVFRNSGCRSSRATGHLVWSASRNCYTLTFFAHLKKDPFSIWSIRSCWPAGCGRSDPPTEFGLPRNIGSPTKTHFQTTNIPSQLPGSSRLISMIRKLLVV